MSSESYAKLLLDERWLNRRSQIVDRDDNKCRWCGAPAWRWEDGELTGSVLQVHHRWYDAGKMPWDHADDCLVTLCEWCHKRVEPVRQRIMQYVHAAFPKEKVAVVIRNFWIGKDMEGSVRVIDEIAWLTNEGFALPDAVRMVITHEGRGVCYAAQWEMQKRANATWERFRQWSKENGYGDIGKPASRMPE